MADDNEGVGIERRSALGLMVGGAAIMSFAGPSVGAAANLAVDTPADRLRAYMLMRGALDDRLVIGCLEGTYHGCVNGQMTAMFGVASATFSRYRPVAEGMEQVSVEQAYFFDLASGARLTRYANPYTGQTVDVPAAGYPPSQSVFTTSFQMRLARPIPGMALTHSVTPFAVRGDDVWMTEVTQATITPTSGPPPSYFQEVVGLHARLSEMTAPGVKRVRCETSYTGTKSWHGWLKMKGHPGETVTTGAGLYGATVATLPASWLEVARQDRPELIADPAKVLDPLWRSA